MSEKSEFWFRWLQIACVAVQAFGAFMILSQAGTRAFFGALLMRDTSAISRFQEPAVNYIDLLHVVLGAVLVGWGVALFLMVRYFYKLQPLLVSRVVTVSILCWAVPDTAYSLWSGFWQNAVLNVVFIAVFFPPLLALRRIPRA
ncbi:hypothetical protein IAI51_18985 [Pseudomonas sp. N40(2020)]|uniref:hypothetical protein n=1 Tax=Pseudomonas sp. N40(2020) TaxID=2767798 RepID=UPI001656D2CF|nr:hypothetical protein [Pseudomonas sp. N40(2020)]MBC8998621.1 hypothetical protein [Pseudomonas sp. N40(2020)]